MFSSLVYTRPIKKLVYEFKYKPYVSDLKDYLAQLFIEGIIQEEAFMRSLSKDTLLVPIPLHPSKLHQRGFNHAELLTKSLAVYFKLPMEDVLIRQKKTVSQFGLTRDERKENLKDAFRLEKRVVIPTVVLVDDIVTSGTTFSEAAHVLKRSGVRKVYGLALAHGK